MKLVILIYILILALPVFGTEPTQKELLVIAQSHIRAANANDPSAQFSASHFFWNGWGVQKNERIARQWLEKSAAQNFPSAIFELGHRKLIGFGYQKSVEAGLSLLSQASDLELSEASVLLGVYYLDIESEGNAIDKKKGKEYLLKASSLNNSKGMYYLGRMYELGLEPSVPMDAEINYERSIYWYTKGAEQLNKYSIGQLGSIYALPQNNNLDNKKAYFWFKIAQKLGYNYWSDSFVDAELKLSSGSRIVVNNAVEEWLNTYNKSSNSDAEGAGS